MVRPGGKDGPRERLGGVSPKPSRCPASLGSVPSALAPRGRLWEESVERIDDYRRAVGTDVWHKSPHCPNWPTQAYECARTKPNSGRDCDRCASGQVRQSGQGKASR